MQSSLNVQVLIDQLDKKKFFKCNLTFRNWSKKLEKVWSLNPYIFIFDGSRYMKIALLLTQINQIFQKTCQLERPGPQFCAMNKLSWPILPKIHKNGQNYIKKCKKWQNLLQQIASSTKLRAWSL